MVEGREFDALFRKYYGELYGFARHFVAVDADCEDIVSDAFEDVWRSLDQLQMETVRPFLYKNVRNKCIDHLRRQGTRRQHAELYARLTIGYDDPSKLLELKEREAAVVRVLQALPDYTRRIFTACYVDRKQYREVADELGISPNTVKKYISQALQLLREQREKYKKY